MTSCPLTGVSHPGITVCTAYTDRSTCGMCPGWTWQARVVVFRRWLSLILARILPVCICLTTVCLCGCGAMGMEHNMWHYSATLAGDIATGLAGGRYYATVDYSRITWTDGETFAVFVNGVLRTCYRVTAHGVTSVERTMRYVIGDAQRHGATVVSASKAIQHMRQLNALGASASVVAVGLLPAAVLCGLYPQLAQGSIDCGGVEE